MLPVGGERRNGAKIIGLARAGGRLVDEPCFEGSAPPGYRQCAANATRDYGNFQLACKARRPSRSSGWPRARIALRRAGGLGLLLGDCFTETYQRGYMVPEGALEQVPIGSTQEQVLIVLGTPSTVATVSGEAFYYISQRAERAVAFMPQQVIDQRVVAVYFDKNRRVERLANYGLQDGKVFDFVSRTTPTGGKELGYLALHLLQVSRAARAADRMFRTALRRAAHSILMLPARMTSPQRLVSAAMCVPNILGRAERQREPLRYEPLALLRRRKRLVRLAR